jgi:putative DNA primase/helicase
MPDDAMFIPLAAGEVGPGIGSRPIAPKSKRIPIIPVPADAPPQRFRHPKHGFPTCEYEYRLATGELVGYALRFDFQHDDGTPDKEVLPVTYCDLDEGKRGWCANGIPAPRPLYGLPELLASPRAPVIVTEGEKKADVVPTLFPGYFGTTSMGGARAAKKI